jgi:SOS-response transcriptional repressor LexA
MKDFIASIAPHVGGHLSLCQLDISPPFSLETSAASYDAMESTWDRVNNRLTILGLTPYSVSLRAGKSRDWLRKMKQRGSIPRGDNLQTLAKILECSVEYILGDDAEIGVVPKVSGADQLKFLPVRYKVEAGAWREQHDLDSLVEDESVFVDQRFSSKHQWLEEVVGDSMDLLIPPGSLVHVVSIETLTFDPPDGSIVVVERSKYGGFLRERTLKQLKRSATGMQIVPRSSNPRWQEAIDLSDEANDDPDYQVSIVGLVIQHVHRWV